MTKTELMEKIRAEVTGDVKQDMQYLTDLARSIKSEKNAAELAEALPEHTVVPYPNVPKREYPRSRPLEVYEK